ncbi:MAG: hypothetical protein U0Q12_13815 [Vicinamibacterales bacterium]
MIPAHPVAGFRRYRPRHVTFVGCMARGDTTLKTYGITMTTGRPEPRLVEAAVDCAFDYLGAQPPPQSAAGVNWGELPSHGVGSLIVHAGREAVFAVLDVWVDQNMLRHQVWAASPVQPIRFESLAPSGIAMCVWELAIIQHERAAWLRHVLTPSGRADLGAYLDDVLEAEV